jgi:hypothetical protein
VNSDQPSSVAGETAARRGEVLVAIMNNVLDFNVAQEQHWYRIPVSSAKKRLKERWPPQWLAFYQTKVFGPEAWAINYYAPVRRIRRTTRRHLFPDDPSHPRADELYHKIEIGPLQRLPLPIVSARLRRVVLIPTTWDKFVSAAEINDLYDETPLEDRLWAEFRRHDIAAERQYFVQVRASLFALDFAVFCDRGQIDVETDGDTWHADRAHPGRQQARQRAYRGRMVSIALQWATDPGAGRRVLHAHGDEDHEPARRAYRRRPDAPQVRRRSPRLAATTDAL